MPITIDAQGSQIRPLSDFAFLACCLDENGNPVPIPASAFGGSSSAVTSVAGRVGAVVLSTADISGLGSAATLDAGVAANEVVQLDAGAKLPAVDGSQLTNLPASGSALQTFEYLKGGATGYASIQTQNYGGRIHTGYHGGYVETANYGGHIDTGNHGGYINTGDNGGYIYTGNHGGNIYTGDYGGYINTGDNGGNIYTGRYGGHINTNNHGGNIYTGNYGLGIKTTGYATGPHCILMFNGTNMVPTTIIDAGWTANADAGDKTAVIPSQATVAGMVTALNTVSAGLGTLIQEMASKIKALEAALATLLLPNA
jgi:hypothetical protein